MSTTKKTESAPQRSAYAAIVDRKRGNQNPTTTESTDPTEQATQENADQATSEPSSEDATYMKRWKDLKSYHDSEITKARQRIRELEESAATSKLAPPKTEEELAEFREQYPDFFDAMMTVSQQQYVAQSKNLQEELDTMRGKLMETEAERALAEISKAHPDFTEVVSSPEFKTWLEGQDPTIQSWVSENETNSGPFIRALDLYKMDNGTSATKGRSKPKSKPAAKPSAADAVTVSGGSVEVTEGGDKRVWTRSEIAAMPINVYKQFAEELDLAAKEGRILNK